MTLSPSSPPSNRPSRTTRRGRNRLTISRALLTLLILLPLLNPLILPVQAKGKNLFPLKPVMGNKRSSSNADASAGAKMVKPRREEQNVVTQASSPPPPPPPPPAPPQQREQPPTKRQAGNNLKPRATARMGRTKKKDHIPKEKKDYSSFLCPGGAIACPIPPASIADDGPAAAKALEGQLNSLADWFRIGFECSEVDSDVENCGACVSLGHGQDCTTIPHARSTGCETGKCQVYQCEAGYVALSDRSACVKRGQAVGGAYGQTVVGRRR